MADGPKENTPEGFLRRNQGTLLLFGLLLYVVLLLIGTIGNVFEIEAINSFWLYR